MTWVSWFVIVGLWTAVILLAAAWIMEIIMKRKGW